MVFSEVNLGCRWGEYQGRQEKNYKMGEKREIERNVREIERNVREKRKLLFCNRANPKQKNIFSGNFVLLT